MKLRNIYFVVRHGESIANVLKIIISDPKNGCDERYGLSEKGISDATTSAKRWKEVLHQNYKDKSISIFSSDFSRAMQTANIFKKILLEEPPIRLEIPLFPTPALRERYFGDWEGKSNQHYHDVWKEDENASTHHTYKVESTQEVFDRTTKLLQSIEEKHKDSIILLVSHGDTLQILQTYFANVESNKHRSLPHLNTAEVRELRFK